MTQSVRETLTARQEKAVVALITSKSLEEAAQKSGVSPKTLYRWRHEDPLFATAWHSARREALDAGVSALQSGVSEAVQVLRECLTERNPHVRIRAALGLIEHGLAAHQSFELEQRIRQLEEASGEGVPTW